jgi:hypothetical protein
MTSGVIAETRIARVCSSGRIDSGGRLGPLKHALSVSSHVDHEFATSRLFRGHAQGLHFR